jgi:Tol biopolymer transport system component
MEGSSARSLARRVVAVKDNPAALSRCCGRQPIDCATAVTGQRGGEFDVYKISVVGGDEIRLTSAPGLDDGPEYTPDGAEIYFNSVRSGRMQIWRMRPDGGAPQQITNDGFNNWFPHISPDGKWLALSHFHRVSPRTITRSISQCCSD